MMDLDLPHHSSPADVLIAEDQPLVRGLLVRLLRAAGHRPTATEDADEALQVWSRHPDLFSLLVTDVRMPSRLDGLDLGRAVRQYRPDFPILYLSGSDDLEAGAHLVAGVNFLRKPFRSTEFLSAVATLLDGSPASLAPALAEATADADV